MNFVGDESLEIEVIAGLRESGHSVYAIREHSPGMPDTGVLAVSVERQEPLITNDKDFGELVYRDRLLAVGVVLLRLPNMTPEERAERLVVWLSETEESVAGHYCVVSPRTSRVRRLSEAESA